jgi:hypothetical protein
MVYDFTIPENILRHMSRLDGVQVEYESRWGVGKLPTLISPELKEKWDRQIDKLFKAKDENRINDVIGLVDGCIRAYAIMEAEALARGHKFHDAEMWDVKHPDSGKVYRIVKNNYDAGISLNDGALVYTLQEVARILESTQSIDAVKSVFPDAKVVKIEEKEFFNDNLPF